MANLTRAYSNEEIAILRANAARGSAYIGELLDRSSNSVASKASEIGVRLGREAYRDNQWTDARIALLKKLVLDGCSAAQIAKQLGGGVTRNAVIGKAARLGLQLGDNKGGHHTAPRTRAAPKRKPAMRIGPKFVPPPSDADIDRFRKLGAQARDATTQGAEDAGVTFLELRASHCQWPLTTPSGVHRFCGAPRSTTATAGSPCAPYCDAHGLAAIDERFRPARLKQIARGMRCEAAA